MSEVARTASITTNPGTLPILSVVIPVRNEAANLEPLFRDLLSQEYPADRYEILVADGESTDGTREYVESLARSTRVRVLWLSNPARLSSAGRNVGARASGGELILIIDGHCRLPGPTYLRDTARIFESTGADCLCRPANLEADGNTWFQSLVAHVRSTFLGHGPDSTIYVKGFEGFVNPTSAGAFYRRSVFDAVGFHDEVFDACEDVEFNYRVHKAGLRSFLSSSLAVTYRPRSTPFGVFKQLYRYGRGRFRFMSKHSDATSVTQLVPAVFVTWLLLGAAGSFASSLIARLYLASLVFYGAVVLWYSVGLGIRYGIREMAVAPLVYLLMHTGLGAGFLAEGLMSLWANPVALLTSLLSRRASERPVRRSTGSKE
jgi:succinoglycan biosynthesis protein ExoA